MIRCKIYEVDGVLVKVLENHKKHSLYSDDKLIDTAFRLAKEIARARPEVKRYVSRITVSNRGLHIKPVFYTYDIDVKDYGLAMDICMMCENKGGWCVVVETRKGYHVYSDILVPVIHDAVTILHGIRCLPMKWKREPMYISENAPREVLELIKIRNKVCGDAVDE